MKPPENASPTLNPTDPTNPDPMRPGTPPVTPRPLGSDQVKPADPTKPTAAPAP
jgi:hypothetical protein